MVNQIEQPENGDGGFDNAKDAGGEQRGIGPSNADGLEHGGRIVVDRVDAGAVLPQEEGTTEEEAVEHAAVVENGLEGLPETKTDGSGLPLNGVVDSSDLFLHVDVVCVEFA